MLLAGISPCPEPRATEAKRQLFAELAKLQQQRPCRSQFLEPFQKPGPQFGLENGFVDTQSEPQ